MVTLGDVGDKEVDKGLGVGVGDITCGMGEMLNFDPVCEAEGA